MPPVYAIGDIHGHLDQLAHALDHVSADGGPDAKIVFIGDYVDRGPDSKSVIEVLQAGLSEGRNWICLKGNHDRFFERFLAEPEPLHDPHLLVGYHWFHPALGGVETLASYGVGVPDRVRQHDLAAELRAVVPETHKAFLDNLHLSYQTETCFFAHAGVRPGVALADQVENDLVWIRQEFLTDTTDHGRLVVHGHTPVETPELRINRLAIDTGAGYGKPLRPVVIDDEGVFTLTSSGRERLSLIHS
jgi:serine/threonine protein phosphatase 1